MTNTLATLVLLKQLIACPSITPNDAGCQNIIAERLRKIGFKIEHLEQNHVKNIWARLGTKAPLIVFAGHTDVVPTGPLANWQHDPFQPTEQEGKLFGRGATDMKSGLAAMIVASENFVAKNPNFNGSIGFLITSDEEGPSVDGTRHVIDILEKRKEKIDYCVVGEASSDKKLGDTIRVGRRGSLHGHLIVQGKQGHIAYPEKVINPIHKIAPIIVELTNTNWDQGNKFFPPTSFQISNIHAGTGAKNVVPGTLELFFNFRFSTASTIETLQQRVEQILNNYLIKYKINWECGAKPFLTKDGKLLTATESAILKVTGIKTNRSTAGGTSDGRFIAPTGAEVVEIGPISETAHQINEAVEISSLEPLTKIYQNILENIFG